MSGECHECGEHALECRCHNVLSENEFCANCKNELVACVCMEVDYE